MANGKTHANDSAMLAFPVMIAVSLHTNIAILGAYAALGCFAGVVLSPDLDQESWTYSEWVIRKIPIVGWLLSWLFFIYWYPYSKAFRHGHWMTHLPVFSTVIRLGYLMFMPLLFIAIWDFDLLYNTFPSIPRIVLYMFIGLCVSDTAHWIRDGFRIWR